jgi:hypothetical protein|eukprot:scaffold3056_cov187-Alexandrium_tamarense.AAC.23
MTALNNQTLKDDLMLMPPVLTRDAFERCDDITDERCLIEATMGLGLRMSYHWKLRRGVRGYFIRHPTRYQ